MVVLVEYTIILVFINLKIPSKQFEINEDGRKTEINLHSNYESIPNGTHLTTYYVNGSRRSSGEIKIIDFLFIEHFQQLS